LIAGDNSSPFKPCGTASQAEPDGRPLAIARHHVAEMNDAYLTNWADALDSPPPNQPRMGAEGAARQITAHILSSGMHRRPSRPGTRARFCSK
jgi:hypothetical protein